MVFALAVLLNFGIRALNGQVRNRNSGLHHWTGIIGTSVSGTFLYLIAAAEPDRAGLDPQGVAGNAPGQIRRRGTGTSTRQPRPHEPIPAGDTPDASTPRGRCIRSGVLFGLGFDTATEVALLVLAGSAVVGGLPFYAVLSLPILFAAGMCLFDALDGCFMNFAYDWAFAKPIRKIYYNLTITGLSVFVAFFIGTIEILGLIAQETNASGGFWDVHAELQHQSRPASSSSASSSVTWIVALGIWHFGQIERKWELEAGAARAEATPGPDYAGSGAGAESLPARD